jgi:hypothetical protein
MRVLAIIGALWVAAGSIPAIADCSGVMASGELCGNSTASSDYGANTSASSLMSRAGLSARTKLTASRTIHVNIGLGTDNATCGAATGASACATYQYAINLAYSTLDTQGFSVTILGANGTLSATTGALFSGNLVGNGAFTLDCGSQTIAGSNSALTVTQGAKINVQNCTFSSSAGIGIAVIEGGIITQTGPVTIGVTALTGLYADRPGSLYYLNTQTLTYTQGGASSQSAMQCSHLGNIRSVGGTINWSNNATYTIATVNAYSNGDCTLQSVAWGGAGTVTGPRFRVDANASIYTATSGNLTYIPGTTSGTLTGGGTYDGLIGIDGGSINNTVIGTTIQQAGAFSSLYGTHDTYLSGALTPAQITADQNNYAPSGWGAGGYTRLRLSSDATRSITGLVPVQDGMVAVLTNVGTQAINLVSQSGLSSAANRFSFTNDISLLTSDSVMLIYDSVAARWQRVDSGLAVSSASTNVIANDAVTNAKLANMANATIKCRTTAGTGDPEDCTATQVAALFTAPTVTIYTSGSGTHTTAANAKYLVIKMIGGGGGGSGSGTTPGAGTTGNASTFGSLTANGGTNGGTSVGAGGTGGTATGCDINQTGGGGGGVATATLTTVGGMGGQGMYGGGGSGGIQTGSGFAAATNSGGGGGGGAANGTGSAGGGGGAGGYCEALIASPSASYSYAVGASAAGGAAGTSGTAGGSGAAGRISVTTYFQ